MGLQFELRRYRRLLDGGIRAFIHAQYPDDFEYYTCALELVDADGFTVLYYLLPLMPLNINENMPNPTMVKKTNAGITTHTNPTFQPFQISMGGTFGRKLRLVVAEGFEDISNGVLTGQSSAVSSVSRGTEASPALRVNDPLDGDNYFSLRAKTGYGATKLLQKLLAKSRTVDGQGRPYYLFLYNLSFNSNWLVEYTDVRFAQDRGSSNMIWNYNLDFTALAPASAFRGNSAARDIAIKTLKADVLQSATDAAAGTFQSQSTRLTNKLRYRVSGEQSGRPGGGGLNGDLTSIL